MTTGPWDLRFIVEAFIYAVTLIVACGLAWAAIRYRQPQYRPPVYRAIRNRRMDAATGDEFVVLECGHELRIVHHHRASWPCGECGAAHGKAEAEGR